MESFNMASRMERFSNHLEGVPHKSPFPGIAIVQLHPAIFKDLQRATIAYLNKILQNEIPVFDEQKICDLFSRQLFPCVTPTGLVLPKHYSALEFNMMMSKFYSAMNSFGLKDRIEKWQTPLRLRVKYSDLRDEEINRPAHASEDPHLDPWAGYSTRSITSLVPLVGDVENNRVVVYRPISQDINDQDLCFPKTKEQQLKVREKYAPEPFQVPYEKGTVILVDSSIVHATHRNPKCGIRFSIDTIYTPTGTTEEIITPIRAGEQLYHRDLNKIGSKLYFQFPHGDEERKDTMGGTVDPTFVKLIQLEK